MHKNRSRWKIAALLAIPIIASACGLSDDDAGGAIDSVRIAAKTDVPAGTKISVYTADGSTLLYSFITTSFGSPTVISTGLINTGYYAFHQGPVYINYAYDNPYGIGSTDFNYA